MKLCTHDRKLWVSCGYQIYMLKGVGMGGQPGGQQPPPHFYNYRGGLAPRIGTQISNGTHHFMCHALFVLP